MHFWWECVCERERAVIVKYINGTPEGYSRALEMNLRDIRPPLAKLFSLMTICLPAPHLTRESKRSSWCVCL